MASECEEATRLGGEMRSSSRMRLVPREKALFVLTSRTTHDFNSLAGIYVQAVAVR